MVFNFILWLARLYDRFLVRLRAGRAILIRAAARIRARLRAAWSILIRAPARIRARIRAWLLALWKAR